MAGLDEFVRRLRELFPSEVYPRELYELVLPPVDIYEDPAGLVVEVDLPGFSKDEISVSVSGRTLNIRAKKRSESARSYLVRQRPLSLSRSVTLPYPVDTSAEISSKYEAGTLTVTLPVKGVRTVKIE